MLKKAIIALILLNSCAQEKPMLVAVSANFKMPMQKIVSLFQKREKKTIIKLIIGSSGKLTTQIRKGAPYTIFLSADKEHAEQLYKEGLSLTMPRAYAFGKLVFMYNKTILKKRGMNNDHLKLLPRIIIANPKLAPYGAAALRILRKFKKSGILQRMVFTLNIAKTFTTARFSGDAALIAKSTIMQPDIKKKYPQGKYWEPLSKEIDPRIEQTLIILKNKNYQKTAKQLIQFIYSKESKKIIHSYGYETEARKGDSK